MPLNDHLESFPIPEPPIPDPPIPEPTVTHSCTDLCLCNHQSCRAEEEPPLRRHLGQKIRLSVSGTFLDVYLVDVDDVYLYYTGLDIQFKTAVRHDQITGIHLPVLQRDRDLISSRSISEDEEV